MARWPPAGADPVRTGPGPRKNLSGAGFPDPAGLTCLTAVHRTARGTGARLAPTAPGDRVRRTLAPTGTDRVPRGYLTVDLRTRLTG
ncbi:hypothetical protein ACWC4J_27130, partial [Streptomyces sp. NPDC001356]